jgi:hypothetical protein
MVMDVAPLVVQERVAALPTVTLCGAAVNAEIAGATVTVAVAVVEPLTLVAVSVYVVVVVGFTVVEPVLSVDV